MWIFLTSSVYGQKPDYPAILYFVLCMFFSPQNYYFRPPLQLPPYRQLLSSPIYSSLILHWKHTPKAVRQEFPCFTFSKNVSHLHLCPQFLPSLLLASVSVLEQEPVKILHPRFFFDSITFHFSRSLSPLQNCSCQWLIHHREDMSTPTTMYYIFFINLPRISIPLYFLHLFSLPLFIAKLLEKNCL